MASDEGMHGPGHLFCPGCQSIDGQSLMYAAWAGWYAARGQSADAAKMSEYARDLSGRSLVGCVGMNAIHARVVGKIVTDDIDYLIEQLQIVRKGYAREEQRERERLAAVDKPPDSEPPTAPAIVPPTLNPDDADVDL